MKVINGLFTAISAVVSRWEWMCLAGALLTIAYTITHMQNALWVMLACVIVWALNWFIRFFIAMIMATGYIKCMISYKTFRPVWCWALYVAFICLALGMHPTDPNIGERIARWQLEISQIHGGTMNVFGFTSIHIAAEWVQSLVVGIVALIVIVPPLPLFLFARRERMNPTFDIDETDELST